MSPHALLAVIFYVLLAVAALLAYVLVVSNWDEMARWWRLNVTATRRWAVVKAWWYCKRNGTKLLLRNDGAVGIIAYAMGRIPLVHWFWRIPAPAHFLGFSAEDYWRAGYLEQAPRAHWNCRCVFMRVEPKEPKP